MSYLLDVILIVFAIAITIYSLFQGKKVIYECRSGTRFVIPVLFFIAGVLSYLRYRDILSLFVFITLVVCGGLLSIVPSGFGHQEFIIIGRRYPYDKIEDLTLGRDKDKLELSFKYKKKTCFLFEKEEKEAVIKDMMKKVRMDKKL